MTSWWQSIPFVDSVVRAENMVSSGRSPQTITTPPLCLTVCLILCLISPGLSGFYCQCRLSPFLLECSLFLLFSPFGFGFASNPKPKIWLCKFFSRLRYLIKTAVPVLYEWRDDVLLFQIILSYILLLDRIYFSFLFFFYFIVPVWYLSGKPDIQICLIIWNI